MKRFEDFLEAVRDSVEAQAKRKNYSENGVAGENKLSEVGRLLEFEPQHGIGEIVYKCAEYLRNPREVLLVKIAGWAGVLWMRHADAADSILDFKYRDTQNVHMSPDNQMNYVPSDK